MTIKKKILLLSTKVLFTPDKAFNQFLLGQLFSQAGENASKVAFPAIVFALASPGQAAESMALVVTMLALPPLLFGWLYGAILDTLGSAYGLRTLLVLTDLGRSIIFVLVPLLYFSGHLSIHMLALVAFLSALFSGLFGPAMFSAVPEFSDLAGSFVQRNTSINMTGHVGLLIGPAIGGLLAYFFKPPVVLCVTGITFFISAVYIWRTLSAQNRSVFKIAGYAGRVLRAVYHTILNKTVVRTALNNTFCAPKTSRDMLLFTILSMVSGLSLGIVLTVVPLYAHSVLHGNEMTLSWLLTASGLGMLTASSILRRSSNTFNQKRQDTSELTRPEVWLTIALFVSGILVTPLELVRSTATAAVILFFAAGLADIVNPIIQTEVQLRVGIDKTGRVLTSLGTFFLIGIVAGAGLEPVITSFVGEAGAFALGGFLRVIAAVTPIMFVTHAVYLSESPRARGHR